MLRWNGSEKTGAVVLSEENINDLDFADPQYISHMKWKDFATKIWHARQKCQCNQR